MSLRYLDADHRVPGKFSADEDVVEGRFVELVSHQRVVEAVEFGASDAAFAGEMVITTSLTPVPGGTEVTITCTNVPPGIREEDHQAGLASTLANLAAYTEWTAEGGCERPISRLTYLERVKISTPFSVMPTECSNWADSDRSRVTAVQPSARISSCQSPTLIIGSIVKIIPGLSTTPVPGVP